MRQLVYAQLFYGRTTTAGIDGGVWKFSAIVPNIVFQVVGYGDESNHPIADALEIEAQLESELRITGGSSFQEVGTLSLGSDHRIWFSTVGSGYLSGIHCATSRHGGAICRVEGGEGWFATASGLISSIFALDDDLAICNHQVGILFLP